MGRQAELTDSMLRQNVLVQRLATGEAKKFERFLREIDKELRARLAADSLASMEKARLERLIAGVDDMLKGVLDRFTRQLVLDLAAFAEHEAAITAKALRSPAAPAAKTTADALVITTPFESVIPAAAQVRAAILTDPLAIAGPDGGSLLEPFLANWTAAERKAVTGAIRLGVFQGKTNQQLVQTLRGTRAKNYADGILATTTRHAETVVRTAVQHVSTAARAETARVNADVVEKVQWLSTLDKRTCPRCGALDGKVFAPKKGPRPPLHPNCRCTMVPVLADEWRKLDAGMKRPAVGARGPGQVDATESYYEWLKRQPAAFQNAAIGVSRATLMRNGGLSASRFAALQMDKNFAPLTLDEMRALEPLAFRRAGL